MAPPGFRNAAASSRCFPPSIPPQHPPGAGSGSAPVQPRSIPVERTQTRGKGRAGGAEPVRIVPSGAPGPASSCLSDPRPTAGTTMRRHRAAAPANGCGSALPALHPHRRLRLSGSRGGPGPRLQPPEPAATAPAGHDITGALLRAPLRPHRGTGGCSAGTAARRLSTAPARPPQPAGAVPELSIAELRALPQRCSEPAEQSTGREGGRRARSHSIRSAAGHCPARRQHAQPRPRTPCQGRD